ncbi:MDR family MFS transporter [Furfurilactobacillus siliginis]|uniref:MFS transporter n=1 Tax=Furfurilactobacillus siliginis TaxID=348151 RepID=A0A0R2L2Y4_9LACO|nr:MDR family MFS transporter [Furfurilactobacillus siliginis]KRN96127.1 drug resistance MFS transporter, drug H+ antiporter-2 family [Furfurilactobacillus siliginis]GEK27949.1 MFS transporter [Furfurilactobacillus siliginis]
MVTKDIYGKPYHLTLFVITLLVASFTDMLNQTVLGVAQPTLMTYFSVSASTIQWLTTGFLLVSAVMIPVTGWLTNRFGTKWLFIFSQVLFAAGTLLSFTAGSFSLLLTGRLIQAMGSGIAAPLSMTMLFSAFPPEKQGQAMGLLGIVFGLAPAIGPTFSGWAIDAFSWRAIFGIVVPISLIALVASLFFIKDVVPKRAARLDLLSLGLSTIGFGSLLYSFSIVGDNGWTSRIFLLTLLLGLVALGWFIHRQLKIDTPLLDISVFKMRNFTLGTIIGAVVMFAMIGFEIILPMYLQIILGMSAVKSGLSLLAGALTMAVASPLAGAVLDKFGGKYLIMFGMLLVTLGTIPFVFVTADSSIVYIIILYAVRNFGMALSLMPSGSVAFSALPKQKFADGSALNNVARQVSASIGTAFLVSMFTNVKDNLSPSKHLLQINPIAYKTKIFHALLAGFHVGFLITIIFTFIAAMLCLAFVNSHQKEAQ